MEEFHSLWLFDSLILNYVLEKLATASVFHYQVKLLWSFYNFIKLDNVRMPNQLKDVDFSGYSLNVGNVLNFVFFKYFNSDL